MDEDHQRQRDLDIVKSHVAQLAEHFDTVQVFTTRLENGEDSTVNVQYGAGNWYARYGQVTEWMNRQDEDARINRRREEDDG